MPTVNGKKYSYTKKGREEAKQASVNKTKIVAVPKKELKKKKTAPQKRKRPKQGAK